MKRAAMLLLFLMSVFYFVTPALAQNSGPNDEQARALAIDCVTKVTNISKPELNTKRLEDLEDVFFSFQIKISGRIRKGAYFYKVEEEGWHIITPSDVTYTSGSSQVWYVGISMSDGEPFQLLGFKNADAGFQRLVSRIPVQVKDVSEAAVFANFYLGTVYGNADRVVYDELRLKHNVEEYFIGYSGSQESTAKNEKRFRDWWHGFDSRKIGPMQPSTHTEDADGYQVSMLILEKTVGLPPELWKWSVEIQKDGTSHVVSKSLVFPTNLKSE
jgi:hypothetical protein